MKEGYNLSRSREQNKLFLAKWKHNRQIATSDGVVKVY